MLKIAVMVSGGGTNLQAIIDAVERGSLKNVEISLVISSNPNAYALTRARNHGIKTIVVEKQNFTAEEEYCGALISLILQAGAGLVVTAGYLKILPPKFIETFENKIINVHPSLIPAFCGDGFYGEIVHDAALKKGVKITGATVHFVNNITDGGPIILQKAVEVLEADTPVVLQKRVMEQAEWILLPKAIELFAENKLEVIGDKVYIKEAMR